MRVLGRPREGLDGARGLLSVRIGRIWDREKEKKERKTKHFEPNQTINQQRQSINIDHHTIITNNKRLLLPHPGHDATTLLFLFLFRFLFSSGLLFSSHFARA